MPKKRRPDDAECEPNRPDGRPGTAGQEPDGGNHGHHGPDRLCPAGSALYDRALREGRLHSCEIAPAPCLVDFGLLHPDVDDMQWLLPSEPAKALLRLLRGIEEEVARERQREADVSAAFEPLLGLGTGPRPSGPQAPRESGRARWQGFGPVALSGGALGAPSEADASAPASGTGTGTGTEKSLTTAKAPAPTKSSGSPALTPLKGVRSITAAMDQAVSHCTREVLTIQPGGFRPISDLGAAPPREQSLLSRGCRMRTLYQHTTRHAFPVIAHFERLEGDVEVRTLSEVTEQLVVFDRTVAFVPADRDFGEALEIRAPALVGYLATLFDRLWQLATPLFPHPAAPQPAENGVTARQRTIAELLVEGLTDADIAERLGMNVRTVRVHIAKLARNLGSTSRTQLGFLIGRSGILGPGQTR
ncbi:helix-turn-helix transcriptional regulator [Streptomyces lasiicapitis]|uniref:helix-turn-helix transcriptional regulator n=1 Tax=Streptomyces lasiicapitis TaxID=1923961 RepID=UPI00365975EA